MLLELKKLKLRWKSAANPRWLGLSLKNIWKIRWLNLNEIHIKCQFLTKNSEFISCLTSTKGVRDSLKGVRDWSEGGERFHFCPAKGGEISFLPHEGGERFSKGGERLPISPPLRVNLSPPSALETEISHPLQSKISKSLTPFILPIF